MKITVKIGAAVDGDLQKILYEPIAAGMARARQKVRSESAGMGNDTKAAAAAAAKQQTATALIEERRRAAESLAITKSRLSQERALAVQQHGHDLALSRDKARQEIREDEKAGREKVRSAKQAAREIAQAQKEAEKGVRSFASSASGTARGIVSRGVGVAADIARGAGVNFDIASGVKKRVDLEAQAVNLANSGYVEGQAGPAGIRQSPRAIMADIQKTGETYGIQQSDIGGALEAFVGKTGELQTGREMLDAFAKTAKATGANIEDVASAAGAISNKLGDVPDKANAINKVMLAIAGQGKVGAVEIKDLATQMEKLTSQASKFKANKDLVKVTGTDTGANIAMLGVLAQAARKTEKGSAAQATQSAMAFVRDLTGQTAIKRIGASTIFADKGRTQLRDPQEIVKDIISKTKGDASKLSYMMSNQNSRAVVNSFMDPYMKAYGGTKGTEKEKDAAGRAAVDEAFKTLKDATLSDKSQNEALAEAMGGTAVKTEQFQQKLDRVVGDMADQVIPSLLKLAPTALDAAGAMARMTTWATENPGGAAGAVAAAGVAKAMADVLASKVAAGLATALSGAMGGIALGSLVVASVGMMAIDHVANQMDDKSRKKFTEESEALNNRAALMAAQRQYNAETANGGTVTPETAERLAKAKEAVSSRERGLEERVKSTENVDVEAQTSIPMRALNSLMATMNIAERFGGGQTFGDVAKAQRDQGNLADLKAELADVKAAMNKVDATLGGGIAIKSLPAGMPGLPTAVTK